MFNLYDEEAKNNSEYQMTSEMLQVLEIYEKTKKRINGRVRDSAA